MRYAYDTSGERPDQHRRMESAAPRRLGGTVHDWDTLERWLL